MTHNEIVKALQILAPKAEWTLDGDDYSGLNWLDETIAKPTKQAIENEIANPTTPPEEIELANKKAEILNRLGITEEEAKLLLA